MNHRHLTAEEAARVAGWLLDARVVAPDLGRAIAALTPVAVDGHPSVSVDRWWRIYLDPSVAGWMGSLDPVERAHVIANHEVMHLVYSHHTRLVGADAKAVNIANDLAINQPEVFRHMPQDGACPAKLGFPDGLTSEQYYDLLLDSLDDRQHPAQCRCGSGAGQPEEFEAGQPDSAESVPGVDEGAAEQIRAGVAADVEAAKQAAGTVPAGLAVWAAAVRKPPVVDWRRQLARSLASGLARHGDAEDSWARLSVRPATTLRPGSVTRDRLVGVIVDTSGSMADVAGVMIPELERICSMAGSLVIVQVDAAVAAITRRMPRTFVGGGGTDLRVGFEALASHRPDVIVVLTDGETPWPSSACAPTIVLTTGEDGPSWATTIRRQA